MKIRNIEIILISLLFQFIYCININTNNYQKEVIEDENVWVVEFYSAMCGSCQEFEPVWNTLTKKLKSLKTGKINIDTKEGLELAQRLGVLDEGIPNIQLYYKKGTATSLMSGEPASTSFLMQELKSRVKNLSKDDSGFYLKA